MQRRGVMFSKIEKFILFYPLLFTIQKLLQKNRRIIYLLNEKNVY